MVVENVPRMLGMIYAICAFLIIVYLFIRERFNRKIGYLFLGLSTIIGFVVFSPMFPNQFQVLILGNTKQLGVPIQLVLLGFVLFILLTFAFGRVFCGYLCPIGAIQELFYRAPVRKLEIRSKIFPVIFRFAFFVVFVILSMVFSIGVLFYFGFYDFFNLNIASVFFYLFLGLLIVSLFIYRPFCRFFCPYGVLLSLASIKSIFKLRRNDNCVDCKKCEKICPTNEADKPDSAQECYLCLRCKDVCAVDAISYRRKK